MSKFSITSSDFNEGEEIPKKFGYKFENEQPNIRFGYLPDGTETFALIMDDPDAMAAVGKVWVHLLEYHYWTSKDYMIPDASFYGKNDFGEIDYGGPAPPDGKHTYIFKSYCLDVELDLKQGFSKQEAEEAMTDHIIAEAKLTGTFTT